MKRVFIFIFALSTIVVKAQDSRNRPHIGLKGGINISNVYNVKNGNFDAAERVGYMAGAFVAIPLGTYLGIQPEAIVSQKGANGSGNIDGVEYSLKRTTTTLDFPVLLQVKPIKFISVVAGPQFSFLLAQKDRYNTPDNITISREYDNQDYRKANVGVVGGVDVYLLSFVLSGRIGADLQKNTTNTTQAPNYKNMWGQVGVGFRF